MTEKPNQSNTGFYSTNEEPLSKGSLRCFIPFKDGKSIIVTIPRTTLKVERENAWAMTLGYFKDNRRNYSSIYTSVRHGFALNYFTAKSKYIPKVISYRTSRERNFNPSSCGISMGVSDYKQPFFLPYKYVAILDRRFYIEKEFHDHRGIELWEMLCNNGIFDQWDPSAPLYRLTGNFDMERGDEKEVKEPQILVLRIYELNRTIKVQNRHYHIDTITECNCDLKLKQPVIPYNRDDRLYLGFQGKYDFESIISVIRNSLEHFGILREEEKINDTSKIEITS